MVRIHHQLDHISHLVVTGFYGILKTILSLILGFIASKCAIFENFSPFSLILLSISPDISLIPTFCYLGCAFGILTGPFNLSVFKYITALTMIYVIYMVFRRSLHIVKNDTAILSGVCCFIAGFLFLLVDRLTLFNVLILVGESVLICCCIYFITYAVRGFRQCCYLSSRELIAAVITMLLILIALHNVYLFSMSVARILALSILLLALCCLKTSHAAVLGSCLGIILAAVGNGGEAVFTAVVVGTLAGCVFSSFSERFALSSFILVYYAILFFFGKFPWNYWYFGEPLVAYAAIFFVPKKKLRSFLSAYIAVKTPKKQKNYEKTDQKLVAACQKECAAICPKAAICYEKNLGELTDALEALTERYIQTESFGEIESALPFCIKPNTMAEVIERRLICNLSQDFEELVEQLEYLSKKIERKMDTAVETVRFLSDEEQEIKDALEKRRLTVCDINFLIDEQSCKKCDIQFKVNGDILYEKIICEVMKPYFPDGFILKTAIHDDGGYTAHLKESSRYEISCAALCKTRSGEQISGDTALGFSVGRNRYYLILADGMGSGKEAGLESSLIINSLRRMITGGLSVVHALNIYRSAARFRQDHYFTTADICSIDLENGVVDFYKAGAFDSYHLHEDKLTVLRGGGLPLGLNEHDRLQHCNLTVHDGDYLILASDGLAAMQQLNEVIPVCRSADVRQFAKNILRVLSESCSNASSDDVTVMVCKFHERSE